MKTNSVIYVLAVGAILGCKELGLPSEYTSVGSFNSRVEAQNQALVHILENYSSLPADKEYKVKYDNLNSPPSEHRQNALWYNKRLETLKLEVDIQSGPACTWEKVTKAVLEQASISSNGMFKIDSLASPKQPTNQCLR